ncbi:MAG: efflux transporter outer membrane subunit [Hydrogenophaga sp.]|uniref:efflux transporter outer membrane subunit n=1 Tax=Hydrogenophaga sp. TaxID=1904254 RepID=UPI00262422E3|nr:efflux transporter outer membrane subunit [Hydrogenophaga sp.]MCV0437158.1 efflux transporter outer membrane subunit [Hydrogenophaga sp.]
MNAPLHRLGAVALVLSLLGCGTIAPQVEPPEAPTLGITAADRFAAAPDGGTAPTEADLRWWNRFNDPALAHWVERALANSPDTAIARERVVQAQALLRGTSARRSPLIGAQAAVDARSRRASGERALDPSAALTLDWDLDLWGGLRQAEQSAAASLLQAEDLAQAARLSVAGLTARAHVAWQEARLDEQLLADGLALQREVLRVVDVRVRAGLAPRLDLDRAQSEAATLEADAADAGVRVRQTAAALQVLAGVRPQPMAGTTAQLPLLQGAAPVARPIDLLRLRPDLRAAERGLAVAAADLGVARADLYPRLRLPGAITLTSGGLGGGVLDIVTATLSAVLEVALFDGGERSASVDAARSRMAEAGEVYRQTLLQALQQAEAALVAAQGTATRMRALERGNAAALSAVEQARTLYANGLVGFLDVLEAQRSALDTRRALLRARADATRQAIATFEALGLIDPGEQSLRPAAAAAPPAPRESAGG